MRFETKKWKTSNHSPMRPRLRLQRPKTAPRWNSCGSTTWARKARSPRLLKGLGKLSAEERPQAGALINVVKQELQELIGARKSALESAAVEAQLAQETIDVTLPGAASPPAVSIR